MMNGTNYQNLQMNKTNKLKIMIVDDGSTDKTWENVQKFKNNPQIVLHTKENGVNY